MRGLLFAILLLVTSMPAVALDTLTVRPTEKRQNLAPYTEVLEDEHHAITTDDLTSGRLNAMFRPVNAKMFSAGYSTSTFWFRFVLRNNTGETRSLMVEAPGPYINELEFFEQQNMALVSYGTQGMDYPYEQLQMSNGAYFYRIELPAHSVTTYYLKARNNVASLRVPLQVSDYDSFIEHALDTHLLTGMFMGIMVLIIVFSLITFVLLRGALYFRYTLYVIFITLYMANNKALLFEAFWPQQPHLNDPVTASLSILAIFMLNRFSQVFLDLPKNWPKVNHLINVINILLLILLGIFFLDPANPQFRSNIIYVYIFIPVVAFVTLISICIYSAFKRDRDSILYLLALSPLLIMSLGIGMRNVNLLPHYGIFEYRLYIGITSEIIIFTFALAYRFKVIRDQQENLLLELNAMQRQRFRNVIEAVERERKRIAIDLHDGLGQLLSTVKLNVSALEDHVHPEDEQIYDTSLNLLDEACTEVREISHNMMPSTLIRMGFLPALKESVANINKAGKIRVSIHAETYQAYPDESRDVALYRVCQELLNNVIKYSGARSVMIKLVQTDARLFLSIKDDGRGFDTALLNTGAGIGWSNIYSRIGMLNGNVKVHSVIGEGTLVQIDIPV